MRVFLQAGSHAEARVSALKGAWEDLKVPILVFLGLRVFLTVVVYFGSPLMPMGPHGVPWRALPDQPLLDVWARWDSSWYANIAQVGYKFSIDRPSNIAFLPLYPLSIKALTFLTGNMWISGILLSNGAFLAALIALFKLAQLKFNRAVARRTLFYIAVFPAAFFFFAMYSESLYLLTVVLAFYSWERRRDWSAGAFGAMAAVTRPMGILLLLSGAAKQLIEEKLWKSSRLSWNSLSVLLIPAGLGAFLVYSYCAFGQPLAFLQSREVGWNEPLSLLPASHRQLAASILDGSILRGEGSSLRYLDAASALVFLALTIPIFRRLGPAYGLYSLGSLAMPLVVTLDGLTRYASVIFPAFMVLASWNLRKTPVIVLASLSAMLMGLLATMFANWYFVG